jgi:hypothetical protein
MLVGAHDFCHPLLVELIVESAKLNDPSWAVAVTHRRSLVMAKRAPRFCTASNRSRRIAHVTSHCSLVLSLGDHGRMRERR